MSVKDFTEVVTRLKSFKLRLENEGIVEEQQNTILKLFLAELTQNKINVEMLQVI